MDKDKQESITLDDTASYDSNKPTFGKRNLKTLIIHFTIWILITVYITLATWKGTQKDGFAYLILIYIFVTLRLAAQHISMTKLVYLPVSSIWNATGGNLKSRIPSKLRIPGLALLLLVAVVSVICLNPVSEYGSLVQRFQSFVGIIVFIFGLYACSHDRHAVPWHTVVVGLILNYIIALFVLKTEVGVEVFKSFSSLIASLSSNSDQLSQVFRLWTEICLWR